MTVIAVAVLSGYALALVAPILHRLFPRRTMWVYGLFAVALTVFFAGRLPGAAQGIAASFACPWAVELGLNLSFRVDGLSLLFALLISGIGALVMIYAGSYLKGHIHLGRFYTWMMTFLASMLGVALADNLLLLFVFWELTSLCSYMLIGFEHESDAARDGALQALLVTGFGGVTMLAGLLLLAQTGGSMELSVLLRRGDALRASPMYVPALLLILVGAFTKSAQFPFHFWLPNAMEAPTPVSAYLHSATMVKAGVYLLARLTPALGGTEFWHYAVGATGALTMFVGAYLALAQTDLKRLLAYSTVSALGTLTLLVGLGTPLALKAMVVLLLAHALYKGALFLVVGVLDHEVGTRDAAHLGGLARRMPLITLVAGVAALSMAGVPPLFGFMAKELIYEAALSVGPWLVGLVVATGAFSVFLAGVVGVEPFWGTPLSRSESLLSFQRSATETKQEHPKEEHKVGKIPRSLWLAPALLSGLSLLFGLVPRVVSGMLVGPAVSTALGNDTEVHLGLWHGFSLPLFLSVATLWAGIGLYAFRRSVRALGRPRWPWGPARLYVAALDGLLRLARGQTRLLQSGYLRYYLTIVVLFTAGLAGYTLVSRRGLHWPADIVSVRFYEAGLAVLILVAAIYATISPSRLGAVAALGAAGYGVALLYLLFGAPDLAVTQFLIDSLTVILFVLVLYHLPHFARLSSRRARLRDIAVGLLAGVVMALLVISAVGVHLQPSISAYFAENALLKAHGRNVVNVILVDFRGLDTLGEITVLATAGIGVYALLKLRETRKGGDR